MIGYCLKSAYNISKTFHIYSIWIGPIVTIIDGSLNIYVAKSSSMSSATLCFEPHHQDLHNISIHNWLLLPYVHPTCEFFKVENFVLDTLILEKSPESVLNR